MQAVLDASALRRWCREAADALGRHRGEIDRLNVFPIPDGDTGRNLEATLRSAADAVADDPSEPTAGTVLRAMARGAVLGALGNSGVIASQVLCGFADAADGARTLDAAGLTKALRLASDAAWTAVSEPVEGTILSVIAAAARAAEQVTDPELDAVITAACAAAAAALDDTTDQLDALRQAGVVDAGGRGLVVLLDALAAVITGRPAEVAEPAPAAPETRHHQESDSGFGYEVQYLLQAEPAAVEQLRDALARLGDSVAVVGTGDGLFNIHAHVDDVGAAIEAGIDAGRPRRISVVRFADQQRPDRPSTSVAVVAVAPGPGLAEVFRSEGAGVVDGDPAGTPSVAEVLAGILGTGAGQVILLPNAAAVGAIAEQAAAQARERGVVVAVVPTKSPVQGLAAVAVHDPSRRFDDNVIALAEAAAATRFAEVTIAIGESITYAGRCAAGDVLGLIDGEVVEIGADVAAMGIDLVRRLVAAGGELVTVLPGADPAGGPAADELQAWLRAEHPLVEVARLPGGQPDLPLLIGVE